MNKKTFLLFIIFFLVKTSLNAQDFPINAELLNGGWNAHWINCTSVSPRVYAVYHFRKTLNLDEKPGSFIIHVSADNRYQLFINGTNVGSGPARSSLYNWNFETYDISQYLHKGKNTIAALVWNMAQFGPVAQITEETAFLLQGDTKKEQIANTDTSWKVLHDTAYIPCATNMGAVLQTYMVVGPGDEVNGNAYPWNWQSEDYNDTTWQHAAIDYTPVVMQGFGSDNKWTLSPRTIPQMEQKMQRMKFECSQQGNKENSSFLQGNHPITIPANTTKTILIDQAFETVGYPVLKVSGGKK